MKSRRGALTALCLAATTGALTLIAPRPAAAQNFIIDVVMSGLNNPRGLAFGTDGALFVAEAGLGGPTTNPSIPGGEGDPVFYGATSSVSRLLNGTQQRVLTGLPSLAPDGGGGATGLHDIVFDSGGQAYGVIGLGGNPSLRADLTTAGAPGANFAQLVRLTVDGSNAAPVNVADLGAYEAANNPDGTTPDTNPYTLITRPGGSFAVVDAGANALLNVTNAGVISTLATFEPGDNPLFPGLGGPTYQAVPTTVAADPDGGFFVGQLTGFPFPQGEAKIFHVPSGGGTPTEFAEGFTNIIDMIVGDDGNLYVLQLTSNGLASQTGPGPGQLIRVDGQTGAKTVLLSDPLFFPGGITQGADGAFYVSNFGVAPGGGQVLRIVSTSAPEPGTFGLLALAGLPTLGAVVRRRMKRST
jgi:hypothetical protein